MKEKPSSTVIKKLAPLARCVLILILILPLFAFTSCTSGTGPEKPKDDEQTADEFEFAAYEYSLWYYEYAPGQYNGMVFIRVVGERGIIFNLDIPGKEFLYYSDIETSGMPEPIEGAYVVTFVFQENQPQSEVYMEGSLTFANDGKSVSITISDARGDLAGTAGTYDLINGVDSPAVQRSVYKEVITSVDDSGLAFVPIYFLYDVDGNGVKELIIREGDSEIELMYNFLTIDRSGLRFIGSLSGTHSYICLGDDGGIVRFNAHMGYEAVYQIYINNSQVGESLVFEKVLQGDEEYDYPAGGELSWLERYDLRLADSILGEALIKEFFDLYAAGDYAGMKKMMSAELANMDFTQGVYGMKTASLRQCRLWVDDEMKASRSDRLLMLCSFEMTAATGSVYSPDQTSAAFFIALEPSGGGYRIVGFSTGP